MKALIAAIGLLWASASTANTYAAGQIWAYKTRTAEDGSLLKIQQVESDAALGPIYHISIIGVHLSNPHMRPELPHFPVSQGTLDNSVTKLVRSSAAFPDAAPGIDQWRAAKGGVFTITVAEIIDLVDQQTANVGN
ncbi:hypothetical protein SPAN111604_00415 [Sphingomonas antarctica]|uniref:hypothetical protein n=1 Tax=Sphingomonas antarctica TaxID=2040274 RepID=UPI0039E8584A